MISWMFSAALAALSQGPATSQPEGMPVAVEAQTHTAYAVKCHIRSYKTREGVLANTYSIINSGPYKDVIPSPNAQCQLWKTGGVGEVTLHIYSGGADHKITAVNVGKPNPLSVW